MKLEPDCNQARNGGLNPARWQRSAPAPGADLFTPQLTGLERAIAAVSRVQGPRRILQQLRELIVRNSRSLATRCSTDEEIRWSQRVHASLDGLIREGDAVLPDAPTPRRIRNRARKGGDQGSRP